jgi:c-di-GMP-binding flagellar brake protein YcgR
MAGCSKGLQAAVDGYCNIWDYGIKNGESSMYLNTTLIISSILICIIGIAYLFHFVQQQRSSALGKLVHANILENFEDIKNVLGIAQEQKVPLAIRVNARGNSFNSSIVEISLSSNPPTLLIDALFPNEGNGHIVKSEFISVEFFLKKSSKDYLNIPYMFSALFLRLEDYQGYPTLRISFPKIIKRDQRRNYLRIKPLKNEPIPITLKLGEQETKEVVYDISGGGIGFCTNLNKSVLFKGRLIDSVLFTLPDGAKITSKLTVSLFSKEKHIINDVPLHYFCRAEFVELSEKSREKIIQYVIKKEREDITKLSRELD